MTMEPNSPLGYQILQVEIPVTGIYNFEHYADIRLQLFVYMFQFRNVSVYVQIYPVHKNFVTSLWQP